MIQDTHNHSSRHGNLPWRWTVTVITVLVMSIGSFAPFASTAALAERAAAAPAADVTTLNLTVISANDSNDVADAYGISKGDTITDFKYIINIDNTGTTEQRSPADGCNPSYPGYPGTCNWVSVAGRANNSPIFTQGNQDDFPGGVFTIDGSVVDLPAGRYLISILADNYKIDGAHFTVPGSGAVTVEMQPYDLPTATVQAAVFEDMSATNSAPDLPGERGIAGFRAHINDYIDEVTTDVFGNPLGAELDAAGEYVAGTGGVVLSKCYVVANGVDVGTVPPVDAFGRCPIDFIGAGFDDNGDPVGDPLLLTGDITQTLEGDPIPVGAVIEGKVIIPNLGPNRYALSVTPPNKSGWIQTTTLEGNHDWDAWVMEGATGLDTEFVVGGEPFPATFFGFVRPSVNTMTPGGTNTITGIAQAVSAYIPPTGGGIGEPGLLGAKPKDKNPMYRLFVSLSDINNGDQTVFIKEFGCKVSPVDCDLPPSFQITGVPDGDYVLGLWDEPQDYIFGEQNVSVRNGQILDVGSISMLGWWTTMEGYVFNDTNGNGFKDPGEPGIPGFPIVMRTRENSIMDRGTTGLTTDGNGYYWMESMYPMTQWLVEEAYVDGFKTTGISYYADNQIDSNGDPIWTTVLGGGVDVNVHPVIGLGGRFDWGVQAYAPGENGGIVGTLSYDTTRNELNPQYAAIEDWQPSISNLNVELYAPVLCGTHPNRACDAEGSYELAQDGSYALGALLNTYLSETWERPSGCVARNVYGNPLVHGVDEKSLPLDPNAPCLEAPLMSVQFGPMAEGQDDPATAAFGASVDGNYGFGDGCFGTGGFNPDSVVLNSDADPLNDIATCMDGSEPVSLASNRDYLVRVDVPDDSFGRPLYQVTREEDINIANGDSFVPQVPPSECAGALHTVDVAGFGADGFPQIVGNGSTVPSGVIVPASTPVNNPTFVDIGASIYEGQQKPLCDMKLVHLAERKSIAPGFNFFTEVPLPGRFWGLLVDDLNLSSDPKSLAYGEKYGIPFAPIGVYDYTNRLITTVESDYNGLWDVLLPSTNRISCPTPSGVCANLYRMVGNDPGTPGKWNANFNPQYRSISAEFEAFAGLTIPADLAPTPAAASVYVPGTQTLSPVMCTLAATQPQLLAVSKPYADNSGTDSFMIDGFGFGASGQVLFDGIALPVASITSWSDIHIAVTVPNTALSGSHQLSIKNDVTKLRTVNGLTFHVFGGPSLVMPSAFPVNATPLDTFNAPPAYNFNTNWSQTGGGFTAINNSGTTNDYLRVQTGADGNISNAWLTSGAAFGTSQEAYFTFRKVSPNQGANQQGLLLKYSHTSGSGTPISNTARWIEVALDHNDSLSAEDMTVRVTTKSGTGLLVNQFNELLNLELPNVIFSDGDQLGARAMNNGDIILYKNGSEIGRVTGSGTDTWTGRIGIRFEGTGSTSVTEAQVDNFGGGDVALVSNPGFNPSLFEVSNNSLNPKPYTNIQSALDAAAAQSPNKDSLVVVYPASSSDTNPRYNGRGAYYENPIMYAPVKLQGVGPGGQRPDGSIVQGTIIDGIAFAGDTALATSWLGKVSNLTWDGNQDINDGQVIYVLASETGASTIDQAGSFSGTTFKAAIDGFNIRGGDLQDLPGNLIVLYGLFPEGNGPIQVQTQGGAIFANSFVKNLQITNNVIESNAGSYGTIRIGTPNIPNDPGTGVDESDQQNDNLRIANNRITSNGGTNLAGAIGVFNGAENYEVAGNDLCGNYSAEYGGAISHFGLSPNGKIHDNRIYSNQSYDEGAGIMVAGELPVVPSANYGTTNGPKGSGAVDIYNNLIQANLSNDDGGGLRFLMAGNFPMNVYNNMLVNNISTHEGGGVALDDAPNVRFYNNTVMRNVTTATALTSDGLPAPAGLSTGSNSAQLQATLPGGSPLYSNPLLFNNIFWNNWAGTKGATTVTGIGADLSPLNPWDMGVVGAVTNQLSPTYSVLEPTTNFGVIPGGTGNLSSNPQVATPITIDLNFMDWRADINFVSTLIVSANLNPLTMGDYHLLDNTSPAYNTAAASKPVPSYQQPPSTLLAPLFDIDRDTRPGFVSFDIGADEIPSSMADLAIVKSDGAASINQGGAVAYSITVTNNGPDPVTNAIVADTVPGIVSGVTWTCATTPAFLGTGTCVTAGGSGNAISVGVNLPVGGSVLLTVNGTLSATATGSLVNTATVTAPATVVDTDSANNSSTDTDTINLTLPSIAVLDNFNRANGVTLNRLTGVSASITVGSTAVTAAAGTFNSGDIGMSITSNTVGGRSVGAGRTIVAVNGTGTTATMSAAATGTPGTSTVAVTVAGWSQGTLFGQAAIRVNSNQAACTTASCILDRQAMWNVPAAGFGTKQGAGFTFANTPASDSALILKASGGSATAPSTFIRVQYSTASGGQILVQTTTNSGGSYTTIGTFASGLFVTSDTLTAVANADGSVDVWKTSTYLGRSSTSAFTGSGRIGMQLPFLSTARVDDFRGATVP